MLFGRYFTSSTGYSNNEKARIPIGNSYSKEKKKQVWPQYTEV